ncbi:hypothetical protein SPSIL_020030 [Sporomusa silvacetica DSM 10669]|uniref:Phage portal protein n=1 Tax=Sporomusa silvacetica DSM 10669 TaxID=1123289 RepID=A0ABZ3IJL8_9FIRM|nr:phage portal protein [Sporomusa silvacetica]OZC18744.1 phage portal protein [Sporomusa silvacetica DSM 10669]
MVIKALKSLFSRRQPERTEQVTLLSGGNAIASSFNGNLRQSDVFLSAVHSIAVHASKMTISHIVQSDGMRSPGDQQLNRLLGLQPNPVTTAAEFLYKCASYYWSDPDLFILLERSGNGSVIAMWPLKPSSAQFVTDQTGSLYIKFLFNNGVNVILQYCDIVHVRRIFHSSDLLGDSNTAIMSAVELAQAQTNGLRTTAESSGMVRGILKVNSSIRPEDLEKVRKSFIDSYLKAGSTIGAVDAKFEYTPINSTPNTINATDIETVNKKIFQFLGVHQSIIDGSFTEETYQSFVESSLEPFSNTLGQALSAKMFTAREIAWGNQISIDTAGKMAFASPKTKITALKELMPLAVLTLDNALTILGFPPVGGEEGARRLQSLNYVDSLRAADYQLANVDKKLLGVKADEGNQDSND